jgi:hypothetical protein
MVQIDDLEYEIDHLLEEAKAHLTSLKSVAQKIAKLQRDLVMMKTPLVSFATLLQELPGPAKILYQHPPGMLVRHENAFDGLPKVCCILMNMGCATDTNSTNFVIKKSVPNDLVRFCDVAHGTLKNLLHQSDDRPLRVD